MSFFMPPSKVPTVRRECSPRSMKKLYGKTANRSFHCVPITERGERSSTSGCESKKKPNFLGTRCAPLTPLSVGTPRPRTCKHAPKPYHEVKQSVTTHFNQGSILKNDTCNICYISYYSRHLVSLHSVFFEKCRKC